MISQSELFWIAIVIVISSIVIIFSLYYSSTFSAKTQEVFRFSTFDDLALRGLANLYTAKFGTLEKTYLQMMTDAVLYLKRYQEKDREKVKEELNLGDKVFYGISLGTYNASDIVYNIFDNLIGKGRWQLIVYIDKSVYHVYGYEISGRSEKIRSYILSMPVPDENIGYIILRVR